MPKNEKFINEELEKKRKAELDSIDRKRQALAKEETKKLRNQQDKQHQECLIRLEEDNEVKNIRESLIYADYKELIKRKPDNHGRLLFINQAEAVSFFEKLVMERGREFLASVIAADNTPTGFHMFSCGDGKLYRGTFQEIHDELSKAFESNPKHPTLEEGLNFIKSKLDAEKKLDVGIKIK